MISCSCLAFPNKNRNLSLLPHWTVSIRQGTRPGQVFPYRDRTMTPIPGLAIPESFMEFLGYHHPLLPIDGGKLFYGC